MRQTTSFSITWEYLFTGKVLKNLENLLALLKHCLITSQYRP